MDDARYEEILRRRERNGHFKQLDYAAKHPKKSAQPKPKNSPQKPAKKARPTPVAQKPVRRSESAPPVRRRVPVGQYGRPIGPQRRRGPAPGTVVPKNKGMTTMPERCVKCDRPLRPRRSRLAEFPGTMPYHGFGLCKGCKYNKNPEQRGKGRKITRPDKCVKCGRTLRDKRTKLADAPGTVPHEGKGMCGTCYKLNRRFGK